MSQSVQYFSADALLQWISALFEKLSVPKDDAQTLADCLVNTSLRGVDTHGVIFAHNFAHDIQNGVVTPQPKITIIAEKASTALIDGDFGLGIVVGSRAMKKAIDKAKQTGVGAVGVRNSTHFGATAYYATMATAEGMIGLAFSNTSPVMAPWGGKSLLMGSNPLALGVPGGAGGDIALDMATTKVAWAKMKALAQAGKKMPLGWATDLDGNPTDDPHVGMSGLMQPIGGHKGYGLALFVELLCAALTGAAFDHEIENERNYGHFFIAIDVNAFLPLHALRERVAGLAQLFHESDSLEEGGRIYLPGEIEEAIKKQRLVEGIPIMDTAITEFVALGEALGLPFPAES